jgi:hypothetical protein
MPQRARAGPGGDADPRGRRRPARFARSAERSRMKNRAVDVNEQVRQWSAEHPGQIVAAREPDKDRGKNDHSHTGEKEIVESGERPSSDSAPPSGRSDSGHLRELLPPDSVLHPEDKCFQADQNRRAVTQNNLSKRTSLGLGCLPFSTMPERQILQEQILAWAKAASQCSEPKPKKAEHGQQS